MYILCFLCTFSLCIIQSICINYKEDFFDQKVDHFNYLSTGNLTFKQRYLYNDTWWDRENGPIFFYAGNEGDIVGFWENTGFMFRIAPEFNALVLFAEHLPTLRMEGTFCRGISKVPLLQSKRFPHGHLPILRMEGTYCKVPLLQSKRFPHGHRYYGKSLPFGNDSFEVPTIGFLSVEQALADYAFFLKSFKKAFKAERNPVIAFGGSYGGMLAAYMRFKYPNIIHGAIAASAPIYLVAGKVSGDIFFQAITKDFRDVSPQCEAQVRAGFTQMQKWASAGQSGFEEISRTFRLCKPISSYKDYQHLLLWIRNAFVYAAMMDYPYASSFFSNFPAYPVKNFETGSAHFNDNNCENKGQIRNFVYMMNRLYGYVAEVMCNLLMAASRPADGLREASALYYNASQPLQCFDIYEEYLYCADPTGCGLGFDSKAWDYQACTEINLEGSTTGDKDMFPPLPFNSSMRDEYCMKTWKVLPRRNVLDVIFWGEDITSASNIVFSNGNLDPWAPGGVLQNISDSLVAIIVDGGAHHLDLRADNPSDPPSVRVARDFERRNIQKWLQNYR